MKKLLLGLFAALGALAATGIAAAAAIYYLGLIDVAADAPHSPLVYDLIEGARERAIARSSSDIKPPGDLANPERVRRGAGNYAAMCADCHLTPGVANSEIRLGLYPTPPDLTRVAAAGQSADTVAARQFWIIRHGIKASGMPAWSKGGMDDASIWDLTAFLGQLPALSAEQYLNLVAISDGHAHHSAMMGDPAAVAAQPHDDKPGAKPHKH
ncbi:MAG: cytochrome c [Gammaproteobacteria bacterium]|nr:cytochrome c [Rhodocyclaceae bacterium]MBU3909683.1 cytochrome c [Gammaproteobacteria bacterium]MBU3988033.1 cytochrome c [Gammaproteobacteria bacterium]MBU4005216.1 cytochrome c [Gammaproteobacteria bacterium]MBU4022395.1 cytochrome c [Gammaproteobacteria bacterium]